MKCCVLQPCSLFAVPACGGYSTGARANLCVQVCHESTGPCDDGAKCTGKDAKCPHSGYKDDKTVTAC